MGLFGLMLHFLAFVIMMIFQKLADEIMFTIEDCEVYNMIVKFLSLCIGNFYFWQALATTGFYHYLRRLADKFPPSPIIAIDVRPSMQVLLEGKDISLRDAASKIDNLDKENAGLRAKVGRLEKEVDFISKDRFALVREKFILQNRLGDFNSWPEFRVEYDELVTEFQAMKMQRAREHVLQEQGLHIAKEAKIELAAARRAAAMSKVAHIEELKQVQQERDEMREKYKTLLATSTTTTKTAAVATTTVAAEGNNTGDKALQEENTRLTLALSSQTSLLYNKSSELGRLQSLLKTRSNHSASQLKIVASTILSLEEDKKQAEERIAELERDVQEANEKAEEMEQLYTAAAFGDEGEREEEEEEMREDEEESSGEERADVVAA